MMGLLAMPPGGCYHTRGQRMENGMAPIRMRFSVALLFCLLLLSSALSASSAVNSPPFYPDKTRLLVYRDGAGREHPIRTAADWDKRRQHILASMQLVMGPLPDLSRQVP